MSKATTALILGDLQNDFLHPEGAYGRAKQSCAEIAALPGKLAPLVQVARQNGILTVATLFTLVPGRGDALAPDKGSHVGLGSDVAAPVGRQDDFHADIVTPRDFHVCVSEGARSRQHRRDAGLERKCNADVARLDASGPRVQHGRV